ncbi:MAG: Chromosome partition protein Smc [Verrucomicrobia subdivision 3 bacterium]|nr:Chromosome partition protein Smc [Limisphaerales bacterium]MCS1414408.1 Chromosome partition protein Smc [Limisphaerales bacterium]
MSGNKVSSVLGVVCVCLIASLIYRHTQAVKKESASQKKIQEVQTQLEKTSAGLDISQQTNTVLRAELKKTEEVLAQSHQQVEALTNDLNQEKARAEAAVKETRVALAEVADRDIQIKSLTDDRKNLSNQLSTLNRSMDEFEARIAATELKLTTSESDREFLLRELKRLQTEKAGIERQFNDLSVIRTQLNKLRNELTISRRIEWIRKGLIGRSGNRKGAEILASGFQKPIIQTNFNLNVEINQTGGVKIIQQPPPISDPE